MVRFARAKGSKASNERVPEQASSWQEMKQQMINAEQKKNEWVDEDINVNIKDDGVVQSEWATFEENEPKKSVKRRRIYENISKRSLAHAQKIQPYQTEKIKKPVVQLGSGEDNGIKGQDGTQKSLSPIGEDYEEIQQSQSKKKKEKKIEVQADSTISDGINECTKANTSVLVVGYNGQDTQQSQSITKPSFQDVTLNKVVKKNNKRCKNNVQLGKTLSESTHKECGMKDINVDTPSSHSKVLDDQQETEKFVPKRTRKKMKQIHKLKFSSRYERKSPYDPVFKTINIEGRLVEICEFGHYKIRKEDWDLLQELQKEMRAKNLPEEEIQKALKKERRRAEKCLSRERKKVCYHCREPGHLLSECPSIDAEGNFQNQKSIIPKSTNISVCFKCGSTEHLYLQCRVATDNEFRFATCFVCGEEGHLSRQCPHNPRGIYPKGGGCKTCGDVTHLVKDCPQFQHEQQQQSTALTLPTLNNAAALEALDEDSPKPERKTSKMSLNKVVKF